MALFRRLQPNSTLRFCRLGFSASRERLYSSKCSDGDGDCPPQLKEEAAAEDTKIILPKLTVSKAVLKKRGPRKPKTLSGLFMVHKDDPAKTKAENEERKHEETLSDHLMMSEKDEKPSQVNGCQNGLVLKHLVLQSANNRATGEYKEGVGRGEAHINLLEKPSQVDDRPQNLASIYNSPGHSTEHCEEGVGKHHYKELVQTLTKRLQKLPSKPTNLCSSTCLIKHDSSNANVQRSDKHDRFSVHTSQAETTKIVDSETTKSGFVSVDLEEKNQCLKSLPASNKDQRQQQRQNSARAEPEGNRVLVRFLQNSVSTSQVFEYFKSCGEILKVECPYGQRPLLKTACIDFKTRDGLEKAISRSETSIGGPIIVESATSENRTTAIPIPSLLGDPDIPAALVKNPTRTIRIEHLTQEMTSRHIVEALAFCNSKVTGYFLGSSDSVAYVELETEIGKERALAKHSINVLGRNLVMLRIDCPRTTAVRITSRDSLEQNQVLSICKSLGDVCIFSQRHANVVDVHYKVAEWPNMLRILNRLNGCGVKGRVLQAEPAPVFPPDVLLALWRHPEERKHLKATAQELLLKLDSKLDTSGLAFLENDIFST